jgi:hypothetical protein
MKKSTVVILVVLGLFFVNLIGNSNSSDEKKNNEPETTQQIILESEKIKEKETEETVKKTDEELRKEYTDSCESINYEKVIKDSSYAENKKIVVEGFVLNSEQDWKLFTGRETYIYIQSGNDIWHAVFYGGKYTINPNDKITCYGEFINLISYSLDMEGNIMIPSMEAKYIDVVSAPETEAPESKKNDYTEKHETEAQKQKETAETKAQEPKETDPPETDSSAKLTVYVLNINSHKIHYDWCSSAKKISDHNRDTTTDFEWAIKNGYKPCKNCNP